jgi:phosphatidylinositol-bisphosphatase
VLLFVGALGIRSYAVLVFSVPQDLRVARKPLHTRLSAAFAGEAGDDFSDIVRIRDDWIRSRVQEKCSQGKQSLKYVSN